ncbi:protein of unknown function [Hyphomicrobium sp. 1Nfss2.1]|uniref:hypothetical protein n=1 Tax=Hyphomicrobium sp. 1Nfss2.1 TaxID=3413936 RepID=UPI003C79B128
MTAKSVSLAVRVWYDEEQGNIHIASKDDHELISTINRDPAHSRGHPHLFNKLAKCLRDESKPAPPEAHEPE